MPLPPFRLAKMINNGMVVIIEGPPAYLRLRSAAAKPDPHGIIIRRVQAQITDPNAPLAAPEDQAAWQRAYVKTIVTRWQDK